MKQRFKVLVSFLVLSVLVACSKQNEPPIIHSLRANPESIYIKKTTQLICKASDPDSENLTYSWSSTNGSFSDSHLTDSIVWNAPDKPGNYSITVLVGDGKHTTTETITIEVLQTLNIEGYVYYSGTLIPISGVVIQLDNEQYTTNEAGKFTLKTGLGIQNTKADKDGFDSFSGNISIEKASDKIRIELTSDAYTKMISGSVKNSFDSFPVEGAEIVVLNPDESESELRAKTSSSGFYELPGVPKGSRLIKVLHPFYRSIQWDIFIAETDINFDINMDCLPPEIETIGGDFVGLDSVILKGIVSSSCNLNIKTGFCYSEKSNPTINDNIIEVSEESGVFSKVISVNDVKSLKRYFYRAFVQTDYETIYGDIYSFLLGILIDNRNNETKLYVTTKIGEQLWMAENLAYLPKVSLPSEISNTEPGYFVYGYNGTSVNEALATENYRNYGVLYNWPAATEACPEGWHLPKNEDWEQLAKYISDENGGYSNKETYWYNVGIHLKAGTNWYNNGSGSDDYGFSALPAGFRSFNGLFFNIETDTYWWSATETNNESAWFRSMKYSSTSYFRGSYFKNMGYCVRCLKD